MKISLSVLILGMGILSACTAATAASGQAYLDEMHARLGPRGMVLVLSDVTFASGHSDINSNTTHDLEGLLAYLNQNPACRLSIEGHADSVGPAKANWGLSQERAYSVMSYLRTRGIDNKRMTIHAMGETMPLATNRTKQGRDLNRRVEVTLIN